MRILLVHCHYRLPGGEDAVFAAERELLQRHGHTVTVLEVSNADATGPAKLLLPLQTLYNFGSARKIRQLIQENNIELVHIHNTLLLLSPAVVRAATAAGVPVVQTLHNFRLFCPNGVLLRGGQICEACPRQGLRCAIAHQCYRGSALQTALVAACYALHRRLGTYAAPGVTLLTPTEFDRQKLLAFNALRPTFAPGALAVKPNTVQAPHWAPRPWAARKHQILYAARLEELKGLRTVIEAWQLLGDDAPTLLVAGTGPLEGWARQNAPTTVQFTGQLPRHLLHTAMAQSKAVVAASLCYESFALVPAEAQVLGTPVLASDLGNVGAAVTPGVNGLRFAPGSAAALADAVRALLQTEFDPEAIANAARAQYDEDANYNALLTIYNTALQRKKGEC